jgi:hypothetical protein
MFSPKATSGFAWRCPSAALIIVSVLEAVEPVVGVEFAVEAISGWNPGTLSLIVASVAQAVRASIPRRESDPPSHVR